MDERSWNQTSRRGGRVGGQTGGGPIHLQARRTRGAVAPAANDSAFAGGAAGTRGTATTRGVGLRHVSYKNRIGISSSRVCRGYEESELWAGSAAFTHTHNVGLFSVPKELYLRLKGKP